jgi:ribosomal protein L40E
MHLVIGLFIFVLVIIAAAIVVAAWIVVNLVRGVKRMIVGPAVKSRPSGSATMINRAICPRADCMAENPPQAHFCRRCGEPMAARAMRRGMKVA